MALGGMSIIDTLDVEASMRRMCREILFATAALVGLAMAPSVSEAQLVLCKFCNTDNGTSYTCTSGGDVSYMYCDGTFFGLFCFSCEVQTNAVPARFNPAGSVPTAVDGFLGNSVVRSFGVELAEGVYAVQAGCRSEVGRIWYDEAAATQARAALRTLAL